MFITGRNIYIETIMEKFRLNISTFAANNLAHYVFIKGKYIPETLQHFWY